MQHAVLLFNLPLFTYLPLLNSSLIASLLAGTRIIMVGTLTALQWLIYDTFKVHILSSLSSLSSSPNFSLLPFATFTDLLQFSCSLSLSLEQVTSGLPATGTAPKPTKSK
jgi:hypothetical protein